MKILLISSSPLAEKSRTFALAKEVVKGLGAEEATETVQLCGRKIEFCRSCEVCHLKVMQCPIKDDIWEIVEKMLAADGIIFASPNYINQVTASMKALFDRTSHFIHCKRLLGKYTAGVVTSGSGYDVPVLDYLKHYSISCGAQYAGGVSSGMPVKDDKKSEAVKLGEALALAIKNKTVFPDQAELIETGKQRFKKLIEFRKKDWEGEYRYLQDQGW